MLNESRPPVARPGILFVVSAPSGAGKTSLCRQIFDKFSDLRDSVSFTTRPMRAGERDGFDYHFVDRPRFDAMIAAGDFVEWAEVHGNRYGTALSALSQAAASGADLLLEIDCQGALQIRNALSGAVFIFVLPPDFVELERRLRGRMTDDEDTIVQRLHNARAEIAQARWYDYTIINDDFDSAVNDFSAIISAERCRTRLLAGFVEQHFP
jgi:guanylate kinase